MNELEERILRYVRDDMCACTQLDDHLQKLQQMSSSLSVDIEEQVQLFKALAESNRLKILTLLRDTSLCACELEYILQLSQPTVTYHLQALKQADLVKMEKEGKWTKISLKSHNILSYL